MGTTLMDVANEIFAQLVQAPGTPHEKLYWERAEPAHFADAEIKQAIFEAIGKRVNDRFKDRGRLEIGDATVEALLPYFQEEEGDAPTDPVALKLHQEAREMAQATRELKTKERVEKLMVLAEAVDRVTQLDVDGTRKPLKSLSPEFWKRGVADAEHRKDVATAKHALYAEMAKHKKPIEDLSPGVQKRVRALANDAFPPRRLRSTG